MSNYTYPIVVGKTVIAARQTIAGGGMAGVAPLIVAVPAFPVLFSGGRYTYADPADTTHITLTAGGLFDLSDNATLSLKCIRAFCGGASTYSLAIQDRGGANVATILSTESANGTSKEFDGTGLIVLPGQNVKITTTAAGTVDVYFTRYEYP